MVTFDDDSMFDNPTRGVEFERMVNNEYKYWKSQTPFLYDLVISHALEWPSLTVEWLPDRINSLDGPYSVQKLVLGTHTEVNEPNYLIIAQVKHPLLDERSSDEDYGNLDSNDECCQLVSGIGCKIKISQQIPHDGEVHRARHMPQDASIIATKTNAFEVHIFDLKNRPDKPPVGAISNPDLRLTGHNDCGFGLSWSKFKKGFLLSSDDDSTICFWDINQVLVNKKLNALQSYKAHKSEVEDVAWHMNHDYLFGSCGSDRYLNIHDFRSPDVKNPVQQLMAHQDAVILNFIRLSVIYLYMYFMCSHHLLIHII
ncbi:histone-binding protein MSI1-like [Rutidosis leptorrhynchoides]|uniref:histone-binding protein MSI1-like n=1 Tax=Rutidosis leptorrhynchoides TaxID=125765 RepID=UPI003A99A331